MIGITQFWLASTYGLAFTGLLFVLIMGWGKLDKELLTLLMPLLGSLVTLCGQQIGYYFSRQRPDTPPPPNTEQTTTTKVTDVTPVKGKK